MKIIKIYERIGDSSFAKSFAAAIVLSGAFGKIDPYSEHRSSLISLLVYLNDDFQENYVSCWDDPKVKILQSSISRLSNQARPLKDMKKEWALAISLSIARITENKDIKFSRRLYFTLLEYILTCIQNYEMFFRPYKYPKECSELERYIFIWTDASRHEGCSEGIEVCLLEPLCGSTDLSKELESKKSSHDSKYPAQMLRSEINRNEEAYFVATQSLAIYIFNRIFSETKGEDTENCVIKFIASQIKKMRFYQGEQPDIYSEISSWKELNHLYKRSNFLDVSLISPNIRFRKLERYFSLVLLAVVVKNTLIYEDSYAISFASNVLLNLLEYLNAYKRGEKEIIDLLEVAPQLVGYFGGSSAEQKKIAQICFKGDKDEEVIDFFLSYPLGKAIDIITLITLCRLPVFDTKKHLEQFILEETNGAQKSDLIVPAVAMLSLYARHLNNIPDREETHSIDGPNGPMQCLIQFTAVFAKILPDLGAHIRACVMLNVIDFYHGNNHKDIITGEDIFSGFGDAKDAIDSVRKKFKFVDEIITGNCYTDSFEKAGDELIKKVLNEKNLHLRDAKVKLEKKLSDLEKSLQNEEASLKDEARKQVEEVNRIADWVFQKNELLTEEVDKQKNLLQSEKIKSDHLSNENKRLARQVLLNGSKSVQNSEDLDNLIKNVVENKGFRLTEYLKLTEIVSQGKLVVLPDAYKNIGDSDKFFKQKDRFVQLIFKLAFEYRKIYFDKGDVEARRVFSNAEYAAQESDLTATSKEKRIQSVRKVRYNGKEFSMRQHLRVGVSNDVSQCIRIYFFPDADNQKIVIGYCGPHPLNSGGV